MRRLHRLGVVVLAASIGCESRAAPPADRPSWSVEATPMTVIGGNSPRDTVIQLARDATRLPGGTVVVADQFGAAVSFFDPDGHLLRTVGRRGKGPGEFGNPFWIDQCGTDSLFVWDYTRRTMVVLDTLGTFSREFRIEGAAQEVRCSAGGWIGVIGFPEGMGPPSDDGTRGTASVWIADLNGARRDSVARVPFGENRALGKLTRLATARDRLYLGTADSAWVDAYGVDGGNEGGVVIGVEGQVPTREQFEQAVDLLVSVTPVRAIRERFRETYLAVAIPEHLPPYRELLEDPSGALWAVVSPPGAAETLVEVAAFGSRLRAQVRIPGNFQLLEVGTDYVLGIEVGDAGDQRVIVYPLVRQH